MPDFGDDWEENNNRGFDYCDADKNGTVDFWEFKHCAQKIDSGRDWSGNAVEREFKAYDLNDDQKIEREESWRIHERKNSRTDTMGDF